jgi:hypothetical protein
LRSARRDIVQVESLRLRIDLEQHAFVRRHPAHFIQIESRPATTVDHSGRGVREDVHVGIP